jgi:hypothetical protein
MRINIMRIRTLLLLLAGLCLGSIALAQEKTDLQDRLIGSTFKLIAKSYVTMTDLKQLRKNMLGRLEGMSEEELKIKYARTYAAVKSLPAGVKAAYGVNEDMNKLQVVNKINSWDKKRICGFIDSIPDTIIANEFRGYLDRRRQGIQKQNIVEQIKGFWNRIVTK